jgi:hypothetical protein
MRCLLYSSAKLSTRLPWPLTDLSKCLGLKCRFFFQHATSVTSLYLWTDEKHERGAVDAGELVPVSQKIRLQNLHLYGRGDAAVFLSWLFHPYCCIDLGGLRTLHVSAGAFDLSKGLLKIAVGSIETLAFSLYEHCTFTFIPSLSPKLIEF